MKSHSPMTLPPRIRAKARVEVGDFFKAKIDGRTITLAPKSMINRELTAALHDVKRGWGKCPFSTAHATAMRFVAGHMTAFFTLHFLRRYQHLSTKRQAKLTSSWAFCPLIPLLRAKKYHEANDMWRARVDEGYWFYFQIDGESYRIIAHSGIPLTDAVTLWFSRRTKGGDRYRRGYERQRGMSSSRGLVNPPGKCNCQSRTGTRSLINCDVPPPEARGGGRSAIQRAGLQLVLSGCGRDNTGLAASLS